MNIMRWKHIQHIDKCVDKMKYKPMNEWMSQKNHIFLQIHASNVFSMHDIRAQNVWIMNEQFLHDFHY
jgi:hypothetical protein